MATSDELLEAVYREPQSDAQRLVYADLLCERGEALGEFIQLQVARSQGRKRTQGREKLLLAAEGKNWWPGHPVWFGQNQTIPWEQTDRGFPSTFNCGWPVSEPHIGEQLRDFGALAGAAGWSTVTRIVLYFRIPAEIAERVLNGSPLRALRRLDSLPVAALSGIAAALLPVEELEIQVEGAERLPAVTGFPSLRRLAVNTGTPLAAALASVKGTGLLGRLETVDLRGVDVDDAAVALEAFASMPDSLRQLTLGSMELGGAHATPDLRWVLEADDVEQAAASLMALPKAAIRSVHVEFMKGGFFTKRNTPGHQATIERALKKFGKAATVSWKQEKKGGRR